MKQPGRYFFHLLYFTVLPFLTKAQAPDTLPIVKLFTTKPVDPSVATTSLQLISSTALLKLNSVSVADAARYFTGVVIKDYGGIGGLKTISVRSLGANHTGVLYDGISLGDAQGGQIDLGRFSLENIESLQLAINQPGGSLLPARAFSYASVLLLATPDLSQSTEKQLSVKLKGGSFGYINPSVSYKANISKNITHHIFAEYQYANGVYQYRDYETGTTKRNRNNADIKALHAEYDAAFFINDSNKIKFKTYYYNSKRGLPGSVVLYNDFSSQRLNNESFFSQLSWKKFISAKSSLLLSAKYAIDYKYYIDPAYQNSAGKLENEFHQREAYISAVYSYKIVDGFSASFATDYFYSSLKRTDQFAVNFANPTRNNFLDNLSVQYKKNDLVIDANLLFTSIQEKASTGPSGKNFQRFTPALAASIKPFAGLPLRVRASYKAIFRAPTFDDLYYTNVGNTNLSPEDVKQYGIGVTVDLQPKNAIAELSFIADAYYNNVKNKILAVPRQNLFQWTMLNVGKVDIKGIDIVATARFQQFNHTEISSRVAYTFQKALDVSDPSSSIYKKQLPYTPEHSGSINVSLEYRAISFSYNVLLSSYRYRIGEQDAGNLVKGWATQDISVLYDLDMKKKGKWQLIAELNNLFNQQYDIIKYYPMPGFNYRLGIAAKF